MAITKKPAASKSTAVVKWDEELAKYAAKAAEAEANSGGGQFFGLKSGVLSWQDSPMPGNQMAVVILDSIFENVYYEGRYDPENPQSPKCFAFGRDEAEMAPHKIVIEASNNMHDSCRGCEMNEWGSADTGSGKACRNTRRLAMIPAGNFDQSGRFTMIEDESHYQSATVGFMKLPVTSVKGYAGFVKSVANSLRRPPFAVVAKVKVEPDPKTQFRVNFEPICTVPDELLSAVMQRHEQVKEEIDFPYSIDDGQDEEASGRRGKSSKSAPAKGRRKY
jgi:hypothetical protein